MHCPLRTPQHPSHCLKPRNVPARCLRAAKLNTPSNTRSRRRQRVVCVKAAKTLYESLGVAQDASDKEIKRAYRQKALKLHPDVNKAPNAQAQFLEVKNAFQVLSDPQQRTQYDRKLKEGFGDFSSWGSAGGFGNWGSSSSTGSRPGPKQQEEDFYGLGDFLSDVGSSVGGWVQQQTAEVSRRVQQAGKAVNAGKIEDFFRDLEKEVDDWSKQRSSSGKPASLWEELAAIGEELVDFLEQGLKEDGSSSSSNSGAGKEGSSSGGSSSFNSSSRRPKSPVDAYEQLKQQYDLGGNGTRSGSRSSSSSSSSSTRNSSSSSSTASRPPPPPPKKNPDDDIEDMLAALKKKMNKT